jgi:hypothetical protein
VADAGNRVARTGSTLLGRRRRDEREETRNEYSTA